MPLFARQISAVQQLRAWLFAENCFYARLVCAAFMGVLAIAGLTAFFIFLAFREHNFDQLRAHTLETLRTANKIQNELANLETEHRGYLLTGQASYREPFEHRKSLVDSRLNELTALVAGDKAQEERVDQIKKTIAQWLQQVALPEMHPRGNLRMSAVVPSSVLGKTYIDQARKILQTVQETAQNALNSQTQANQSNLSFEALVYAPKLEGVVSEMEKAECGYLLTSERSFLDYYKRSLEDFYAYHGHLCMLESGNHSQLAMLGKIRDGLERWQTQIAQQEITTKQEGRDVTAMVSRYHGNDIMEGIRIGIGAFERNEMEIYDRIDFQAQLQRLLKTGSLAALCVFATFFLIASSWYSFSAYTKHLGKIESAEAQTRSIIATVVDGILTMTEQGVILSVNPAAEKMFGYKAAELIGTQCHQDHPPTPLCSRHVNPRPRHDDGSGPAAELLPIPH